MVLNMHMLKPKLLHRARLNTLRKNIPGECFAVPGKLFRNHFFDTNIESTQPARSGSGGA